MVEVPKPRCTHASCTIEAELDSSLLQDHEGFQIVVQRAYESCEKAVQDQITQLTNDDQPEPTQHQPPEIVEVRTAPTITGASVNRLSAPRFTNQPSPRPATASQVKAIRAIAARRKIDLVGLLREKFGLTTADELGIRQASNLIDELKSDEPTASPQQPQPHERQRSLRDDWGCSMIAAAELLPLPTPENPASTNPANEVAKRLTGRDYISWSVISTFRTCPLKYRFRYVDGLLEESLSRQLIGHIRRHVRYRRLTLGGQIQPREPCALLSPAVPLGAIHSRRIDPSASADAKPLIAISVAVCGVCCVQSHEKSKMAAASPATVNTQTRNVMPRGTLAICPTCSSS